MNQPSPRSRNQFILRVIGTLVSVAYLIYLFVQQGWGEVLDAVKQVSLPSILLMIVLMVISRLAVASRWYVLLRTVAPEIAYLDSVKLTFAGLFAANFLPTTVGGDILRLAIVTRRAVDKVSAATSVVADRLVGLTGMAMMVPVGAVSFYKWFIDGGSVSGAVQIIQSGALLGLSSQLGKVFRRIRDSVIRFMRSLVEWFKRPRALVSALSATWVHMICLFTIIRIILGDMGESLDFWNIAGLWSFTYFLTLVPISISGLGLREVSIGFIFPELGGISISAALSLGLILRALDWMISLPGAYFLPGLLAETRRGFPKIEPEGDHELGEGS